MQVVAVEATTDIQTLVSAVAESGYRFVSSFGSTLKGSGLMGVGVSKLEGNL